MFSLKTHNKQFEQNEDGDKDGEDDGNEDGEKETPVLSMLGAFALLTGITVCVAVSSECVPILILSKVLHLYHGQVLF